MKKNITITNKDSKLTLTKSKNLMNIADKILAKKNSRGLAEDESWMQRLWDWADENNISSEDLPRDADRLLTLEYLDLEEEGDDGYVLNEIAKEIGMLSNLTRLTLSVSGDHCKALPEEIGMLTNLEEFFVSNWGLGELNMPKSIINLTHLNIVSFSGNILTPSIELVLHNCESLSRLYIDNNQTLKMLPKNICHCSSLKELVLVNNRNLLLAVSQFKWAINLRDDEKGWEREYSFITPAGTSCSYITDYGQKFRYYSITPFDGAEKIPKPDFPSKDKLLSLDCI